MVVISIISLLSSIVFASLSSAKERARGVGALKFNASLFNVLGANAEGYWNFNEGSGTVYNDVTNQHSGAPVGSPSPSWSTDTPTGTGSSLSFMGTGYVVTAGTVSTPSPHVTISAWIKTSSTAGQTIFSVRGGGHIYFGLTGGRLYVYVNNSNSPSMISPTVVADGKWHHVAWTSDGVKSVMYIDGQTDLTLARTSTAVPSITAYIGRDVEYPPTFTGLIDDVAMYAQTMLASDIRNVYLAGLSSR